MRLARQDPDAAVDRYAQLVRTRNLTSESASAFALAVALPLAWGRDARAEDFFARVSTHELDDNVLEWRARAAMWAGNWSLVTETIAAMSETNRQSARWRYWSARALDQTGDSAQAHRLFAALAPDDNYYSGLAAARLGMQRDAASTAPGAGMKPFARAWHRCRPWCVPGNCCYATCAIRP